MKVLIFLDTINKESLLKDSTSFKPLCHKNKKTKNLIFPLNKKGGGGRRKPLLQIETLVVVNHSTFKRSFVFK
jgi:hypothetical protein